MGTIHLTEKVAFVGVEMDCGVAIEQMTESKNKQIKLNNNCTVVKVTSLNHLSKVKDF